MKKSIIAIALLFACAIFNSYSQVEIQKEEFPDYQGIVTTEGKSASDIYAKAKTWIALNFKSANDVIQLDDKENGILVVKGNTTSYYTFMKKKYPARVHFTLKIDIKDNKFRYTFEVTDVIDESGAKPMPIMSLIQNKPTKNTVVEIKQGIATSFAEFTNGIYNSIVQSKSDEW